MKLLDRYILTSFLTTFASVFVILFFIFILQGIWLFIAELAGKDLDIWLIAKFLLFYSPKMIPLVLPLSILLASIMTFGNFAENYEFAAMKSSGISLSRAMRGLTIFIFGLSIVAFLFANNVIPKAEYKFINLRKNILQRKPAMAIAEGQFNAIGNFNIKVDKKSGENGEKLTGVTIHQRATVGSNATIIRSKRGLLKSSESSNLLQLELFEGYYYEEVNAKKPAERLRMPFAKSSFSKQIMNIDLTVLNSNDMDEEQIANTNTMLNVRELNYTLDSLETNYTKDAENIATNLVQRANSVLSIGQKTGRRTVPPASAADMPRFKPGSKGERINRLLAKNDSMRVKSDSLKANAIAAAPPVDTIAKNKPLPTDLMGIFTATADKQKVLEIATNTLAGADLPIKAGKAELFEKTKSINNHWLALYDKFVIAYACLMMFFIGAPLGAIIRKGGLGLPIVFAVLIFIIFHFINTFGKKVAQENGIPPFLGAWMSSFVLTPLAVLLTYRATNDIGMINMDVIMMPLQRAVQKIFRVKAKE